MDTCLLTSLLLAAISLHKNKSQMFDGISIDRIKKIRINSSLIMFQSGTEKIRQYDITDQMIVRNLVTGLMGDRGVCISHKERSGEHEHAYIDKRTDEFCSHLTTESSSGKSRHKSKISANVDILDKVGEVFGSKNKFESVCDVARAYRYCEIEGYKAVLLETPTVKKRTLYFDLRVDQHVMSSSAFERSECLIGVIMKKGRLVNVLIRDKGVVKKISDVNFNKKIQHLFSIF